MPPTDWQRPSTAHPCTTRWWLCALHSELNPCCDGLLAPSNHAKPRQVCTLRLPAAQAVLDTGAPVDGTSKSNSRHVLRSLPAEQHQHSKHQHADLVQAEAKIVAARLPRHKSSQTTHYTAGPTCATHVRKLRAQFARRLTSRPCSTRPCAWVSTCLHIPLTVLC